MGLNARVIHIEGELFGATALDVLNQYTDLETLFKEKNKGMLFIPYKKPFYAVFTKLDMLAKGDGKVISYSAEFIEDNFKAVSEVEYA